MKREEKRLLKEIEKGVEYAIKQAVKQVEFKVVSNCIYKKLSEYFLKAVYLVRFIDNQYKLILRFNIKLYNYDNIFWEAFDMKDNCSARESLRANGAFTAPSLQWDEKTYTISDLSEVEEVCNKAVNDFSTESKNFIEKISSEHGDFDLFVLKQSGIMDEMLLKMLANINMKKYADAASIAESELKQGRGGRFQNKGIDINDYVLMYCRNKMNCDSGEE